MKRAFDVLLILLSAPLWVPVVGLTAVLVRIRLGSPVIFRQVRPGVGGQPFQVFKFRTMTGARDDQANYLPDEQRLTTFGRWLRATSLDELPELFNVLRGEMSLVGPRPLLMQYLPRYTTEQARRHEVRPGITGWAQVNGRNNISWEEKFRLDVWYVDHQSLWLDIKILVFSLKKVALRENINATAVVPMPEFCGAIASDAGVTPGGNMRVDYGLLKPGKSPRTS